MKKIFFVGGFLGAGKTTLLYQAARVLARTGNRIGLITNDQAPDLVDTALLAEPGRQVREVSGSCFCCNFPGLLAAIEALEQCDYVIAEPVGSCTDLVATIMQPLKDRHPGLPLAPLSVLLDPERLPEILGTRKCPMAPDALYIQYLQLKEADFIVINKIDSLDAAAREDIMAALALAFPQAKLMPLSARTGEGVAEWLEHVEKAPEAGTHIVEIDYDRYADGEAALGWFNGAMIVERPAIGWENWGKGLMAAIHDVLRQNALPVGHVKFMLKNADGKLVFNLVSLHADPDVTGVDFNGDQAELILNARVQAAPAVLEQLLRDILQQYSNVTIKEIRCFAPGRPNPTYRYESVLKPTASIDGKILR